LMHDVVFFSLALPCVNIEIWGAGARWPDGLQAGLSLSIESCWGFIQMKFGNTTYTRTLTHACANLHTHTGGSATGEVWQHDVHTHIDARVRIRAWTLAHISITTELLDYTLKLSHTEDIVFLLKAIL
jgi:hypothetical protein